VTRRARPDASDADRVLHYIELYAGDEKLTHQLIASALAMHPRWVFQIVSDLGGNRTLLGGLPSSGYRLAEYREDAERRNAAIGSQIEEMRQRLRRRKAFARTLPKRPAPPSNGADRG
jgi:hypothetical protein